MLRLAGLSCAANTLHFKFLDQFMTISPCYTKGKGWSAHIKLDDQLTGSGNTHNGFKIVGMETEQVLIYEAWHVHF